MFSAYLGELLSGLALIAVAILAGYWLIGLSRKRPNSILVGEGMIADMVCVGEVAMLVGGAMLSIRAVAGMV